MSLDLSDLKLNLNAFTKIVGLELQWEARSTIKKSSYGDCKIYQFVTNGFDVDSANRIATIFNKALKTVEGPEVKIVKSRSGGFRVLIDPAILYDISIQEYIKKNPLRKDQPCDLSVFLPLGVEKEMSNKKPTQDLSIFLPL